MNLLEVIASRHRETSSLAPDEITGLQQWVDATAITGLSDGDAVVAWIDLSGNANHLTSPTSGKRPKYKTNIINSNPAVLYDGIDDVSCNSGLVISQPVTIFMTFYATNAEGSTLRLYYGYTTPASYGGTDVTPNPDEYFINSGSSLTGGTFPKNTWTPIIVVLNGASSVLYQNGTSVLSGNPGSNGTDGICYATSNAAAFPFAGYFGEIGVYNKALNATEIAGLNTYLANKWT